MVPNTSGSLQTLYEGKGKHKVVGKEGEKVPIRTGEESWLGACEKSY